MRRVLLSFLWLSIFLTAPSAFTAPPGDASSGYSREALVEAAYLQFYDILNFLVYQDSFLAQLNKAEMDQYSLLINIGQAVYYGTRDLSEGKKPQYLPPAIVFSDDPSIFQLAPDQPARSAMTEPDYSQPIFFNRRLLNDRGFDPSYLDIIQILIHEMGHKLGKEQNQTAMDSFGVKVIAFLKPYLESVRIASNYKVQILALPVEVDERNFIHSAKTVVLTYLSDRVRYDTLDLSSSTTNYQQFLPTEKHEFGTMTEKNEIRIKNLRPHPSQDEDANANFPFTFDLEMASTIHDFRMELNWGNPSRFAAPAIPMIPTSITRVQGLVSKQNSPGRYGRRSSAFAVNTSPWAYSDMSLQNQVLSAVKEGDHGLTVTVSDSAHVQRIQLLLKSFDGDFLVEGQAGSQVGSYHFHFPDHVKNYLNPLTSSEVILNSKGLIPLPDFLEWRFQGGPNPSATPTAVEPIGKLQFFDGQAWRTYGEDSLQTKDHVALPAGPIRFRLSVGKNTQPAQIRLRWIRPIEIYWETRKELTGHYAATEEDSIDQLRLVEEPSDSQKNVYEFSSHGMLANSILPSLHPRLTLFDGGKRKLNGIVVTDTHLRSQSKIYYWGTRRPYGPYLSVPDMPALAPLCSEVLLTQ